MVNKSRQTQCQLLRYIVRKPIISIFKYKQKETQGQAQSETYWSCN